VKEILEAKIDLHLYDPDNADDSVKVVQEVINYMAIRDSKWIFMTPDQ